MKTYFKILSILIAIISSFGAYSQEGTNMANPVNLGVITSYQPEGFVEERKIEDYGNNYGGTDAEIFYKFTVTGNTDITIALGGITQNHIYLLDANGGQVASHSYTSDWSYLNLSVSPGIYYLVVEGAGINNMPYGTLVIEANFYVLDDSGAGTPTEGVNMTNAIFIGGNDGVPIDYIDSRSNAPALGYGNDYYGNGSDDIFYKFTIDGSTSVNISTCDPKVYFPVPNRLYLLNSNGNLITSNDGIGSPCYGSSIQTILGAGTYYIVVKGYDYYYGGNYTLKVQSNTLPDQGINMVNAILIGNYSLGGITYSYHDNRSNAPSVGYGNETGQASDDIYYKLIVGNTSNVTASLCGSNFDTYLYLLNASGTVLQSNNDNGPSCSGLQSSLQATNLSPGTYYLVAEGNGSNSGSMSLFVSTEVQGSSTQVVNLPAIIPSSGENYILTKSILVDNVTSESQVASLSPADVRAGIQYMDGLGRGIQKIAIGASPDGRDIVTPVAYDAFGRADKNYLPYAATTNSTFPAGSFRSDALNAPYTSYTTSAQYQFYQQESTSIPKIPNPYTELEFEPSPLDRVLETAAPGEIWGVGNGHTVKNSYLTNSANEVRLWTITTSGTVNTGAFTNNQYYPAGRLYKNILYDEKGNAIIEYKDKEGHMVCKKVQDGGNTTNPTFAITDYIYDDFGTLAYVVPPALESLTSFTETTTDFLNYIYAYHYDGRKRLIDKKIPGSGWEYTVYNTADRPVYIQNASHRDRTGGAVWSFMKYDRLGRIIMTGEVASSSDRASLQSTLNTNLKPAGSIALYEARDNNQQLGYTETTYPVQTDPGVKVFTVNYYDNYTFFSVPVIAGKSLINSFRVPNGSVAESTVANGLPTATLTRILGTTNYLLTETIYDDKGRLSKVIAEHQLNGVDETTNTYNFAGELLSVSRQHYKDNALALTLSTQNVYDHAGRITQATEQINQQTPLVTNYIYNAIGQLEVKKNGNKAIVQSYNPRGWLSKTSSPLFSQSLYYHNPSEGPKAQYNGNIAEQIWITGESRTPQRYLYRYDKLNRLTNGSNNESYNESLTYDKMGNIKSLIRTGTTAIPTGLGTFIYDYGNSGNQLQSFTNHTDYNRYFVYNSYGSVTEDGQIKTAYNELNLPRQVTDYSNNVIVSYIYDASGRKLTKQSPTDGTRNYIDGIEYMQNISGMEIDLLHTQEGIARNIGGTYLYEHFLTDHLGNTRVVYNTAGAVLQQTDFYPFGMEINRMITSPKMNYTYNGKELQQEFGQYDHGARFYDPVIGRWAVIDPAEQFENPYLAMGNNPVMMSDPDGRFAFIPILIGAAVGGTLNLGFQAMSGKINGWGDGFKAFGIGAAAGAAAVLVPQAIGHIGSTAMVTSKGYVASNALAGAISGAVGGGLGNFGNAYFLHNKSLNQSLTSAAWGAGAGAALGGIFGHLAHSKSGGAAVNGGNSVNGASAGTATANTQGVSVTAENIRLEGIVDEVGNKVGEFSSQLPRQVHHFATNKHSIWTPKMQAIAKQFGLDLDGAWNTAIMPHLGRHPEAYHQFVFRGMQAAAASANGNQAVFIQLFNTYIRQPVLQNPLLLRKIGW